MRKRRSRSTTGRFGHEQTKRRRKVIGVRGSCLRGAALARHELGLSGYVGVWNLGSLDALRLWRQRLRTPATS